MSKLEEQQYEELKNLAHKLHLPIVEAFWELEVRDKSGRLIQRHRQRSHSWVRNAYNAMFSNLAFKDMDDTTFGAGKLSWKLTNASVYYNDWAAGDFDRISTDGTTAGCRAAAGEDNWGILVGSGTDAESFEGYALQTQILDGTGAGQLSHVESEPHSITYTAGTKTLKNELARYFNNNSGDTISVNEIALVRGRWGNVVVYLLHARDKLASTVNIPDTGQLKVTYTIQLVYPA